ncbi:MAG: ATP-binding protein [Patescibacteria group bacterium]
MKINIRSVLSKWYVTIVLLVAVLVAAYVSFYLYYSSRDSIGKQLVARAETMAASLDLYSGIANLDYTDTDISKPEYAALKKSMKDLRAINNDASFVYLLGMKDGNVVFVVDSENPDSPDYSPPGQVYYEASPELRNIWQTDKTIIEGPSKDRWGTWVSALAPVTDKNGRVVAVAGLDLAANNYIRTPILYATFPAVAMLVLLFLIAMGVYFRRSEMSILSLKAQFVAIASHELRNPLTGIRWSTETLLKDPGLSDSAKEIVGKARNVCLNLIEIVNQLLDLTVIESGLKQKDDVEVFKIKDSIEGAWADQKLGAEEKSIKILYDGIDGDAKLRGSALRMRTLFSNLIANCIKYSKAGSTFEIKMEIRSGRALIDVIDEGIGVPKDELPNITKGFFRATNAKAESVNGTGLGLHLCVRIVESFNGKIRVRSEEGIGTVVSIELPLLK